MKKFKIFEVFLLFAVLFMYFCICGKYSLPILITALPIVLFVLLFKLIYERVRKIKKQKTAKWFTIILLVYVAIVIIAPGGWERIVDLFLNEIYWGLVLVLALCFFYIICSVRKDVEKEEAQTAKPQDEEYVPSEAVEKVLNMKDSSSGKPTSDEEALEDGRNIIDTFLEKVEKRIDC